MLTTLLLTPRMIHIQFHTHIIYAHITHVIYAHIIGPALLTTEWTCPCYADADTVCPRADGDVEISIFDRSYFELSNLKKSYFDLSNFDESYFELSNFKQSYFELSKLTLIPGGKVAMLLAVRNCSEVGRSSPQGARRPLRIPGEYK